MRTKASSSQELSADRRAEESAEEIVDAPSAEVDAEAEDAEVTGIFHLDIVLLGPPGAGKGTQADFLARRLALAHIDEINLIRNNVQLGTALGELALAYLERDKRLPDDLTEAMVEERLGAPDTIHGFILDGFPQALHQAELLDQVVRALNRRIAGAMFISLPDDEIHARLSGRLVCSRCARPYHLQFVKPRVKKTCDDCRSPLVQRDDDTMAGIAARMEEYRQKTLPVIDYYNDSGLLIEIDGRGEPDAVLRRTLAAATSLIGPSPLH